MTTTKDFVYVQKALQDVDFPATKEQLVAHAQQGDAEPVALRMLKALPRETYRNMTEIRRSVPIDPAADADRTTSRKTEQAHSPHSHRIAEYLRE